MGGFTPSLQRLNITVTSMPLTPVEEQYELVERKAIAVDVAGNSYALTTSEPKVASVVIKGCDMQVDTQAITTDSTEYLSGSSWSFTLKGKPTTIHAKATAGSGTLYIQVYK